MAQTLSSLPIGAKVKFGKHSINGETALPISWIIVAKNHSGYPSNSVTLLSEKIIDLRAYDGTETNLPGSSSKAGNNNYGLSNIDAWLNSDAVSWYNSRHTYDTPPNNDNTLHGTGYSDRPGFLNNFDASEVNAILSSTISVTKYGATVENIVRKVFLPSFSELGVQITGEPTNGTLWSYFSTNTNEAFLSSQCLSYTLSASKPSNTTMSWSYWMRSVNPTSASMVYYTYLNKSYSQYPAEFGSSGVRPALNLPASASISDVTDSDGCYTFNWNSAPPVPTTLNVPTIYGGKSSTISWTKVTDPEGDAVTYQLESSINGGEFTVLYNGANLSYTTIVQSGSTNVQFRLKAIDSLGASSGYISSTVRAVVENSPPTISGNNEDLGIKNDGFTHSYTITDADNNPVNVTESIDGTQVRSYIASLGATNTLNVTGNTWVSLRNGNHTITIVATDGIDTTVRTLTFTKTVNSFTIMNSTPMISNVRPTRMKLTVSKTIPPEAIFKVEMCNNGFDNTPTWEDATSSVNSGLIHLFENQTKTATNWGVCFRVTVNRNGGSGACYVNSIGGNFE